MSGVVQRCISKGNQIIIFYSKERMNLYGAKYLFGFPLGEQSITSKRSTYTGAGKVR